MENLRVLEGSEVFFRGLQHLHHQFKSGWRLLKTQLYFRVVFFCNIENFVLQHKKLKKESGLGTSYRKM